MNFCIKVWEVIKKAFTKNDNSKKATTLQRGNKKTNRATRNSNIYDNSQNESTNITHTIVKQNNNYYNTLDTKNDKFGLIVTARWLMEVPHKIERRRNGIDEFNLLVPSEPNYKPPMQFIKTDGIEYDDKVDFQAEKLYFLIEPNSNSILYDFMIKQINLDLDGKQGVIQHDIAIIATIKEAYPFAVQIPDLKACRGKILVDFGFSIDNTKYTQRFEFDAIKDDSLFIQRQYNDAIIDKESQKVNEKLPFFFKPPKIKK